jgi:hypothetical protein
VASADKGAEAVLDDRQLGWQHTALGELQQADAIIGRRRDHGSERRRQRRDDRQPRAAEGAAAQAGTVAVGKRRLSALVGDGVIGAR